MNLLAVSLGDVDFTSAIMWLACWFFTIGLHEGGHAWMAWWRGDDTAYLLGKRSINPTRHVDWNDRSSVISTVAIPVITVFTMGWPMGIAWVPVNPSKMRNPLWDNALVGLAGPLGNLVGMIAGALLLLLSIFLVFQTGGSLTLHPFHFDAAGTSVALALLAALAYRMMLLNMLLGLINLVPIPGVDGGSVLYPFLNYRGREMFDKLRPYGLLLFVVIMWFVLARPVGAVFAFFAIDVTRWLFRLVGGA